MTSQKDLNKLAMALGGLPVLGCRPDSPSDRAGLVYGDILLSVNGRSTPDWSSFIEGRSLSTHTMRVEIFRDGIQLQLEMPLDAPDALAPAQVLAELIAERLIPLELTAAPLREEKPN